MKIGIVHLQLRELPAPGQSSLATDNEAKYCVVAARSSQRVPQGHGLRSKALLANGGLQRDLLHKKRAAEWCWDGAGL
jgi:hypothetical protein